MNVRRGRVKVPTTIRKRSSHIPTSTDSEATQCPSGVRHRIRQVSGTGGTDEQYRLVFSNGTGNIGAGRTLIPARSGDQRNDVFVRDLATGKTTRVSVDSRGRQAGCNVSSCESTEPALSAHGRYVAFESSATSLVPRDTNKLGDAGMCNWKSSLFFLTIYLPEWIIQSKGYMIGRAVHHRIVSDAHNGP